MTHRGRIAIAGVVLAVGAAACGSTSASGSKAGPKAGSNYGAQPNSVLTAYNQTTAAKTAKVSINEMVTATSGGTTTPVTVNGSGALSFANQTGALTLMSGSGGSIELRVLPPDLYLKVPAQAQGQAKVPGNKPWVKVNVDKVTQAQFGAGLSQLSNASSSPTQSLSYLQGVSDSSITQLGTQMIRGVPTTEFKATVDLDKAAAKKGPQAQAATKRIEAQIHTSSFPIQLWLDHQGRVRQVSYQLTVPIPVPATGSSATGSSTTSPGPSTTGPSSPPGGQVAVAQTIDFYDFGTPVTVTAPPPDQVYDVTAQATQAATTSTT